MKFYIRISGEEGSNIIYKTVRKTHGTDDISKIRRKYGNVSINQIYPSSGVNMAEGNKLQVENYHSHDDDVDVFDISAKHIEIEISEETARKSGLFRDRAKIEIMIPEKGLNAKIEKRTKNYESNGKMRYIMEYYINVEGIAEAWEREGFPTQWTPNLSKYERIEIRDLYFERNEHGEVRPCFVGENGLLIQGEQFTS